MAKKKIDLKKVAINTLIGAGTGVVAQIGVDVLNLTNKDYEDYGMLALGVILPEVVKNDMVSIAGQSLIAVAGYKLAQRYNLSTTLGIKPIVKVAGLNDFRTVQGSDTGGWNPQRTYQAQKIKRNPNPNVAAEKQTSTVM